MNVWKVWKLCIRILAVVLISISSTHYEHAECTVNSERTSRLPACKLYCYKVHLPVQMQSLGPVKGTGYRFLLYWRVKLLAADVRQCKVTGGDRCRPSVPDHM